MQNAFSDSRFWICTSSLAEVLFCCLLSVMYCLFCRHTARKCLGTGKFFFIPLLPSSINIKIFPSLEMKRLTFRIDIYIVGSSCYSEFLPVETFYSDHGYFDELFYNSFSHAKQQCVNDQSKPSVCSIPSVRRTAIVTGTRR
jgi:hypothetical protein